jgi:hypothetical protein
MPALRNAGRLSINHLSMNQGGALDPTAASRPRMEFRLQPGKARTLKVLEMKSWNRRISPPPRRSTPDRLKPELQTGTVSGR